jgi:hypothetical protein
VVIKNQSATASSFWPNPVTDRINLNLQTDNNEFFTYYIYNLSGNIVKKGSIEIKRGYNSSISLPDIRPGLYEIILFANSSKEPISLRFVKQ